MIRSKRMIYGLTLMAYLMSLAHSIVPHHHHDTYQQAVAHGDHSRNGHHHDHDQEKSKSDHSTADQLFFLSHVANADVILKHGSIDNPFKSKKPLLAVLATELFTTIELTDHQVFHPPQDDKILILKLQSWRALRAPPSSLA